MNLSLPTIRRGLRNLFAKRLAALDASKAGAYYKDELHGYFVEIETLPAAVTAAPFKDELRSTDDGHDKFGKVIYLVTETCFTCPNVDPAVITAARQIRDAFIPSLDELQAPYATEGERAGHHKPLLTSLKTQLEMFALPWESSKTLFDIATSFVQEGEKLDELLHQRADVPKGVRSRAASLRSNALGTLNRFRKDLKKEIKRDTNLPRDLEHSVFGFFDTLHSMELAGRAAEPIEGEDEAPKPPAGP